MQRPQEGLTPEAAEQAIEAFRAWLTQLESAEAGPVEESAPPAPDLHTMLGQMAALRQEVNLQTRAVRAQQEQNAATLEELTHTVETLERVQAAVPPAAQDVLRPVVKVLVELHDALTLAAREVQRAHDALLPALESMQQVPEAAQVPEDLTDPPIEQMLPSWARWLGVGDVARQALRAHHQREQQLVDIVLAQQEDRVSQGQSAQQARQVLTALVAGYSMSVQRLERALQQHALEPIDCVGEPFDPETMEVIEVVAEPGRTATIVLDEVRRGYRWQGKLLRCAQVRVARPG